MSQSPPTPNLTHSTDKNLLNKKTEKVMELVCGVIVLGNYIARFYIMPSLKSFL